MSLLKKIGLKETNPTISLSITAVREIISFLFFSWIKPSIMWTNFFPSSVEKAERIILFINSFLDIIYIIVALGLIFEFIAEGESIIGHGFGVIIQALFLLIFDTYYGFRAYKLPE